MVSFELRNILVKEKILKIRPSLLFNTYFKYFWLIFILLIVFVTYGMKRLCRCTFQMSYYEYSMNHKLLLNASKHIVWANSFTKVIMIIFFKNRKQHAFVKQIQWCLSWISKHSHKTNIDTWIQEWRSPHTGLFRELGLI